MNRSVTLYAELGAAGHISSIIAIVFLGPLVDTWGRKPIMLLGLLGTFSRAVLYMTGASFVGRTTELMALLAAGAIVAHLTNAFSTAVNAMVADLSRPDLQGRSAAFAAKGVAQNLAQLSGFVLGYFVLKLHLTSYSVVMAACAFTSLGVLLLAFVVLKDTTQEGRTEICKVEADDADTYAYTPLQARDLITFFSDSESSDEDTRGTATEFCQDSLNQFLGTFVIFWQDPFLRQFIGIELILALASPTHHLAQLVLMNQLDYSPEASSLLGIMRPIFGALGAFFAASSGYRLGSYASFGGALLLEAVALSFIGLCGPFLDSAEGLFWSAVVLSGISHGMIHALGHSLMSVRVGDEVQGRLFAFHHIVVLVGSTIGEGVFSAYLYDADWTGWASGASFFVGATIIGLSAIWLTEIYWCVIRPHRRLAAFTPVDAE